MIPFEFPPINTQPIYNQPSNTSHRNTNVSSTNVSSSTNSKLTISLQESMLGFDQDFATRVKQIWSKSTDTKNTFQNDLNYLNSRWNISMYIEGASKSEGGLSGTVSSQILWGGGFTAVGILLLSAANYDTRPGSHRQHGTATIGGGVCLLSGALIPYAIYKDRIKNATQLNHECIVEKNLSGRLSPLDCKRLSTSLMWAWERGIKFDLNNEKHLQGIYS
ncbi:MAG TPA: hypothetical protein VGP47_02080 [Parachlamydiaceae bacterium]|nr:hypothetical protein [Parachlamydiaceae bacterium]